ncbi:MAG: hypothetical protein U1F25_13460 [Rubrivivax sp.]
MGTTVSRLRKYDVSAASIAKAVLGGERERGGHVGCVHEAVVHAHAPGLAQRFDLQAAFGRDPELVAEGHREHDVALVQHTE